MLRSAAVACLVCFLIGFGPRLCRAEPPSPMTLPNGLRIVLRERHTHPLVAIDLWVQAGAREERAGEYGCAHFLEHTLFKGTTTRGPGDIDIAAENLGAVLHAATGPDSAHFYTTTPRDHLGETLLILADVVRNATLPDAEVERERGVILDELAQHNADEDARLVDLLYAVAFPSQPYGRSPGGTVGAIGIRGRDSLAAFYHRTYRPDRCTLALAGDVTPETARAAGLRAFGDWANTPQHSTLTGSLSPVHNEPLLNGRQVTQTVSEGAASRVGIAFRAPAASEKDMACAAVVTAALLGESNGAGRLAISLPAGTEATARVTLRREASLFLLTALLPPANLASHSPDQPGGITSLPALENALIRVVTGLISTPPSLAELNAAKRRVLGRAQFDLETDAGLARALGYADIVDGDMPETFAARVRQLTPADIRRFAQTSLDPAHCLLVRLVPSTAKIGAAP